MWSLCWLSNVHPLRWQLIAISRQPRRDKNRVAIPDRMHAMRNLWRWAVCWRCVNTVGLVKISVPFRECIQHPLLKKKSRPYRIALWVTLWVVKWMRWLVDGFVGRKEVLLRWTEEWGLPDLWMVEFFFSCGATIIWRDRKRTKLVVIASFTGDLLAIVS